MKKRSISVMLTAILMTGTVLLSGCQESHHTGGTGFGETNNGIYLNRDLTIVDCMTADFDMSKYDAAEYAGFLQQEIDAYNASVEFVAPSQETNSNGETVSEPSLTHPVEIERCEAKENVLYQELIYATANDFLQFNGEELASRGGTTLKVGTLDRADSSILTMNFVDEKGEAYDLQKVYEGEKAGEYRYIMCDYEAVLYGAGDIVCYTTGAKFDEKDYSLSVPTGSMVIVIFKS